MEPIQTVVNQSSIIHESRHINILNPLYTPLSRKSTKHKETNTPSTFTSYQKSLTSNDIHSIIKILCKAYPYRSTEDIDALVDFFENFQVLSPDIDFLVAKNTFRQFIAETKHKFIKENNYIFKKHDDANQFYFILRGEAEMLDISDNTPYVLDYGNILGEAAMFDAEYHRRTTYCKAITANGVHIAYWNRNIYNKYIGPIQKLPIYKYRLFDCHSPSNGGHSEKYNKITVKEHGVDTYGIWMAALSDSEDESCAYFDDLYPVLCRVFIEYTQCKQVPSRNDLWNILLSYGAQSKRQMVVSTQTFIDFFLWFKGTFGIVGDLLVLFDLGCNLFCSLKECEFILNKQPKGTFMLSLSKIQNGVNLSYRTEGSKDKDERIKHIALIRREQHRYKVYKTKKAEMRISKIIRSFVKIKYLYTPRYLCVKKSIF